MKHCPTHPNADGARRSEKLYSVTETAARLAVNRSRVLALIREGRLPAQRVGAQWAIREKDLDAYRPLPTGRPKTVTP